MTSPPGRLAGRVAVITGAGRGIGRATALRLVAEGAQVVLGDIDAGPLESVAGEISGGAPTHVGDTSDPGQAAALIETAVSAHGTVDILVNNAGVTRDRMFHLQSIDDLETVLDANFRSAWNATQAAVTVMRSMAKAELEGSGAVDHQRKVVFTTSVAALTGNRGQANYTSAKGALIALARTLAQELGPFGINVNAVAPGFIETRLTAEKQHADVLGIPADIRESIRGMISLGRFGQPEDIAAATAFLVSPDSDYISGVTLPVTGGQFGGMG
ncbi:MAG TPA: SDR family oxidoreductase [Actinomycetes bacterium]|nr:SDR family oxidoreductase [Actinomycetes bacterium]